jgi:2,4-dienoyl-CoA reductase-like NADH-dependent reductase (Old Yellow Enzyme family)
MCQYSAVDGFANDWHLIWLESCCGWCRVNNSTTSVSQKDASLRRSRPLEREHIEKLLKINQFIVSQNSVPGIQLAHAGRKASAASPWNGGRKVAADQRRLGFSSS